MEFKIPKHLLSDYENSKELTVQQTYSYYASAFQPVKLLPTGLVQLDWFCLRSRFVSLAGYDITAHDGSNTFDM